MSESPVSTPVAEHNPEPSKDFIFGAAPPAIGAFLLVAVVSGYLDGLWAGISGVIGGLLSTIALAVGPLVMHWARDAKPVGVMSRALVSYVVVVVALGVAYASLDGVEKVDGTWVGVGVLASACAWLGGQYRTLRRLRLPVFEIGVPFEDAPHRDPLDVLQDDTDGRRDDASGDRSDDVTEPARGPAAQGGRTDGPPGPGEGPSGNTG